MTSTSVNNTSASGNTVKSKGMALKTEDFIKMMITQLQNQDPLEPAKNQELLAQMSQIGQLQASTSLTDSLKSLVLQNNLGAAGNLIGKNVQGQDDHGEPIEGVVTSVRVESEQVFLELDNGKTVEMAKVTSISPAAGTAVEGAATGGAGRAAG